MTAYDTFERDLTDWLGDAAAPRVPDYTDAIVQLAVGRRQRPRWTFLERWLPMSVVQLHPVTHPRFPWRTVGLLVALAALIAILAFVVAGSPPRTPPPFGLAANGWVAYENAGDIHLVDPRTAARRSIVTGPEEDHVPRWSPDGTRIAFARYADERSQIVIVSADGRGPAIVTSEPIGPPDPDGLAWAPDGRKLVVPTDSADRHRLVLIDTAGGGATPLPIEDTEREVYWRPPDGREFLFMSSAGGIEKVYRYDTVTGDVREAAMPSTSLTMLRIMGWTPDGRRYLLHGSDLEGTYQQTLVVDAATGASTALDVGYGHLSNAGDRVVGPWSDEGEDVCVVDIDGGPCKRFVLPLVHLDGTTAATFHWSPDDRWIVVQPMVSGTPILLDPATGAIAEGVDWAADGVESWQRLAP